ncbi:MAG: hypothetical protein J4G09_06645 [Proteobacteria bacterium]|nr:hypothetical protein [Pseudomonadota bacterium]
MKFGVPSRLQNPGDEVFGPKLPEHPETEGCLPRSAERIDSEVPTLNWLPEPVPPA